MSGDFGMNIWVLFRRYREGLGYNGERLLVTTLQSNCLMWGKWKISIWWATLFWLWWMERWDSTCKELQVGLEILCFQFGPSNICQSWVYLGVGCANWYIENEGFSYIMVYVSKEALYRLPKYMNDLTVLFAFVRQLLYLHGHVVRKKSSTIKMPSRYCFLSMWLMVRSQVVGSRARQV